MKTKKSKKTETYTNKGKYKKLSLKTFHPNPFYIGEIPCYFFLTCCDCGLEHLVVMERNEKLGVFAKEVTLEEGKKKSISIAQVKEVLKIVDTKLDGELYKLIRKQ